MAEVRKLFSLMLKDALSVLPVPLTNSKAKVSPLSVSVAPMVATVGFAKAFSATDVEESVMLVGADLVVTVTELLSADIFPAASFAFTVNV